MRPSLLRALLLIVPLAIAASGCTTNTNTATTPTPTPVLVTETFAGALTPTGANYHTLTAKPGNVVMTMNGIGPDSRVTIGMSIGVFSVVSCTAVMDLRTDGDALLIDSRLATRVPGSRAESHSSEVLPWLCDAESDSFSSSSSLPALFHSAACWPSG
jgi:hypothetical protein